MYSQQVGICCFCTLPQCLTVAWQVPHPSISLLTLKAVSASGTVEERSADTFTPALVGFCSYHPHDRDTSESPEETTVATCVNFSKGSPTIGSHFPGCVLFPLKFYQALQVLTALENTKA